MGTFDDESLTQSRAAELPGDDLGNVPHALVQLEAEVGDEEFSYKVPKRSEMTALGPEIQIEQLEDDPYPIYKRLRQEQPVARIEQLGLWFVTRWDDVRRIAGDSETFSADTKPSTLNRTIGKSLMRTDGSYHREVRSLIEPPFSVRAVRTQMSEIVSRHANALVATFLRDGEADLVTSFTQPLSILVLRDVLGLHEVEVERLGVWFDSFAAGGANFEGDGIKQAYADRGSTDADSVLAPLLKRLEKGTDDSILSSMLKGRVDGRSLDHAEILANVKLMILGGMQEPRDLIGMTLIALLQDAGALAAVQRDRGMLRAAVEESLRCFSPVGTLTRQTRRPVELAGIRLAQGEMVAAVIASANRDEQRFLDPDCFDLNRNTGSNLAFGIGPHFCIGAALARVEAKIALNVLLDLPDLRLDPARPPLVRGWEFRGPTILPVTWAK